MRTLIQFFTLSCLTVICLGCGGESYGPTGTIEGKLTIDAKPAAAGYAVSFMQMKTGFLAYGMTDGEGKFKVNSWNNGNMPIGSYDVMVSPPGSEGIDEAELSADARFDQQQVTGKKKSSIPIRYRDTTTSGLSFDIKEGKNNFTIDLKSK